MSFSFTAVYVCDCLYPFIGKVKKVLAAAWPASLVPRPHQLQLPLIGPY